MQANILKIISINIVLYLLVNTPSVIFVAGSMGMENRSVRDEIGGIQQYEAISHVCVSLYWYGLDAGDVRGSSCRS
jgi:hypothetical protein